MTALEPGDRARWFLRGGNRLCGLLALLASEYARNGRRLRTMQWNVPRGSAASLTVLTKYIATLLPTSGLSSDSATCVILGRCIRSHTSSL